MPIEHANGDASNGSSVVQLVASASGMAFASAPPHLPPPSALLGAAAAAASASTPDPLVITAAAAAIAAETAATKPLPVPVAATAAASSASPAPAGAAAGKPHPADEADADNTSGVDSDYGVTAESRAHARSERKRTREKQRRSDVNAQFASLTGLLRKIEQEDLAADAAEQRAAGRNSRALAAEMEERKSTLGFLNTIGRTGCPTNRADLISMTICVLERMHAQNGRIRTDRRELQRELAESKSNAEDLARKHKQAEAAAQQAALGAAHAAVMPKQDKVMMMVPMMVTPDQVAGVHNTTHGMQMPYPFMPPHMSPAAGFMPQMQQQPQAHVQMSPATSVPSQPTNPAPTAAAPVPAPIPHTASHPAPQAPSAPQTTAAPQQPPVMPAGFQMMMPPNPGGFYFNNGKLPAQSAPLPMPNHMMMPSTMIPNPLQQSFSAAPPAGGAAPGGHPQHSSSSSHPAPQVQAQPPQFFAQASQLAPGTSPQASSQGEQQKPQGQDPTLRPPSSPVLQGGTGSTQFPPPPPGGAPGGSSSGGASGGGGGNLAHCA